MLLFSSLFPVISHILKKDRLSVIIGNIVCITSLFSLLVGGLYYKDNTAVLVAALMFIVKAMDRY